MDDRVAKLIKNPHGVEAIETTYKIPFAFVDLMVIYSNLLDGKPLTEKEEAMIGILLDLLEKLDGKVGPHGRGVTHLAYIVDEETGQVVSVEPEYV